MLGFDEFLGVFLVEKSLMTSFLGICAALDWLPGVFRFWSVGRDGVILD